MQSDSELSNINSSSEPLVTSRKSILGKSDSVQGFLMTLFFPVLALSLNSTHLRTVRLSSRPFFPPKQTVNSANLVKAQHLNRTTLDESIDLKKTTNWRYLQKHAPPVPKKTKQFAMHIDESLLSSGFQARGLHPMVFRSFRAASGDR